jgi:hypothetical protein
LGVLRVLREGRLGMRLLTVEGMSVMLELDV